MIEAEAGVVLRRGRRRRPISEKLEIVRLTMEPDASVAEIARAHGMNANQLFKWRRLFQKGQLGGNRSRATSLLPVTVSAEVEATVGGCGEPASSGGAIHLELPGRATISIENGADPVLLRCVLESLRK